MAEHALTIPYLKDKGVKHLTRYHDEARLLDDLRTLVKRGYHLVKISVRNGYIPADLEAVMYDYDGRYGFGRCVVMPCITKGKRDTARVNLYYYVGE